MRWSPVLLSAVAVSICAAAPGSHPRKAIERAQIRFDAGEYREVLSILKRVGPHPEADFLRAYAHYKLGHLERADRLLEQLLAHRFTARCGLLRGMVALERRQFRQAAEQLEPVVASGQAPWSDTGRELLSRVQRAALTAERGFSDSIDRAKAAIEARRHDVARRELDLADGLMPGQHLPRYYRGLMAYRQRRFTIARRLLEQALALEPEDGWSAYMLALTYSSTGQPAAARPLLARIASHSTDAKLRQVARQALQSLEVVEPKGAHTSTHGPSVGLEVGTGLDTNPYYVDELDNPVRDSALGISAGGRLSYLRPLSDSLRVDVGLRGLEQAYVVGGEGVAQTDVAAWLGMVVRWRGLEMGTYFNYDLLLYGHEPLFSVYTAAVELGYPLQPWLRVLGATRVSWRAVLDLSRRRLEALQVGGAAGLRLVRGRVGVELVYEVVREWADPATSSIEFVPRPGGNGPPPPSEIYDLTTDYSMLAHGPQLWGRVRLPWQLSISAGAALQMRLFGVGDVLQWETGTTRLDPRRDLRLTLVLELARQLPVGLQVALLFQSLDNFSAPDLEQPMVVDRDFARRQLQLVLRWNWPLP